MITNHYISKRCFHKFRIMYVYRAPMTLSVLTERRVHHPPGYDDGEEGACGLNILVRADGRRINLGSKAAIPVFAGVSNFISFASFA